MKSSLTFLLFALVTISTAYGDSFTVNSSAAVTYLANGTSTSSDFPSAFTPANFSAAQTGSNAAVLSSTPFYTTSAVLAAAGAQWIATSAGAGSGATAGYTALFAISFNITSPITSGSLTINYEVDNQLGGNNPGIYLNGVALPNTTGIPGGSTSSFNVLQTYSDANVGANLVQGTNWLYVDAVNLGAEAGLIFSTNISTTTTTAPEPASFGLFFGSLAVLGVARARKRIAFPPRS